MSDLLIFITPFGFVFIITPKGVILQLNLHTHHFFSFIVPRNDPNYKQVRNIALQTLVHSPALPEETSEVIRSFVRGLPDWRDS
ncbi:hypothetical protein D3C74_438620 [compost metagenome]